MAWSTDSLGRVYFFVLESFRFGFLFWLIIWTHKLFCHTHVLEHFYVVGVMVACPLVVVCKHQPRSEDPNSPCTNSAGAPAGPLPCHPHSSRNREPRGKLYIPEMSRLYYHTCTNMLRCFCSKFSWLTYYAVLLRILNIQHILIFLKGRITSLEDV